MKKSIAVALALCLAAAGTVQGASVALSLGIRETGGSGPIYSNAGATGGIEWVNRDGQSLELDGTWQQFSFTPSTDTLLAFAGATANSVLDVDWAALEHIRILNEDGVDQPIRLWIDNVTNTDASGSVVEGFEGFAVGDEVMFQEPNFSGSTAANLIAGGTSAVSAATANTGSQSYQVDFQFVDGDPTRWVRLTTFNAVNLPNAALHVRDATAAPPTVTFFARGEVIPEPATIGLSLAGLLGMIAVGRRCG